ncbi:hypothetical protein H0H81_006836 [Sphagnurus paluster]|uniref:Chromo domain-containing protein n=1 Tax=Sphagnurus paluster TaxID=117069 RepID=A0A9P7FQX7_9AGAR|nr:hypothetical protein H0H81_006836 [Sphagnurus paluster]
MNPPPPIIVDGVPELEVEKILDSRWYKDGLQYLVKWQGQPNEESTWEWAEEVKRNAKESVDDYHRANPDAPRPLTITIPPPKKQVRILTRKKEELPRFRLFNPETDDPYLIEGDVDRKDTLTGIYGDKKLLEAYLEKNWNKWKNPP